MSSSAGFRFAHLIRVSTEKQEQQGESLNVQRKSNSRDVERLGGTVVALYGGQEHATAGWERNELDRLLADAAKDRFDAVIVSHADRWSRDNGKSKEGLEVFRKHGIKFYVGSMEMNLFDPQHCFILGMSAEVGEFIAAQQSKKSIESRIERARTKGFPTCGKLPFGRTFDEETKLWGLDPNKHAMIQDVASRYLRGEALTKLAREHGVNHSNLCKVLRERCGEHWEQEFHSKKLGIHEVVDTIIPPLLDEKTIRAVRQRLDANRTYLHKPPRPKHEYLLSGRIFCSACGYCMFGQVNQNGHRYYRHCHADRVRECSLRPRPWVRADMIEEAVIRELFLMFGNPAAIHRAVKATIPDCDDTMRRRDRLREDLAKVEKARARVVSLVVKEALTETQAEEELKGLKDRERLLREELERLTEILADVPDEESVRCYVEQIQDSIFVFDEEGNQYAGGNDVMSYVLMTYEERRALIHAVFNTPLPSGQPAGVYITQEGEGKAHRPKKWTFKIRGRLEFECVMRNASY